MLFNKRAIRYSYTRDNTTKISRYTQWSQFACAIQPVSTKDWFDQSRVMNTMKMYTNYNWLVVGDKIMCEWITYIVDSIENRDWTLRKFNKVYINKSDWI